MTAGISCGSRSDGCGGTIDCGVCTCTPATFTTDCPSRACETASACTDNKCVYEPVICTFEACTTCVGALADGGCSDSAPRSCGAMCGVGFCAPTPTTTGGVTTYGNVCQTRAQAHCGLCDLGSLVCSADGGTSTNVCDGITVPGVNPEFVQCDGSSPAASVIYLDTTYLGATRNGARGTPFTSLADALAAAASRSSRALIIAGSPTFPQKLTVSEGLSIYGGFTAAPDWQRDTAKRPVFDAPATIVDGNAAGIIATNVTLTTELAHLEVRTADLTGVATQQGANNVGLLAQSANGLVLRDVVIRVGVAQGGAAGTSGATVTGTFSGATDGGTGLFFASSCPQASGNANARVSGGLAGALSCNGASAAEAAGGVGASIVPPGASGGDYQQGGAAPGGAQGGLASNNGTTLIPGPGQDGAAFTTPAMAGMTNAASLSWLTGAPVAVGQGGVGTAGANGRGGGGGGAGFRGETNFNQCRLGGGGGGGGAGGCGGLGGTGGWPGGWSIGIAAGTSRLSLSNVSITTGAAGAGGSGGPGGAGQMGQAGGVGGPRGASSSFSTYDGSNGGRGGQGQTGGSGGAGSAGRSVGVACEAGSAQDTTGVTVMGPTGVVTQLGCP